MEDIKPIIAKNITQLRLGAKMTQSELAEKLNYSDKAISKWERAESIPDVAVLKSIADLFAVPLDYLVRQEHQEEALEEAPFVPDKQHNHRVITTLSVLLVWFVATLVYVLMDVIMVGARLHWLTFPYAIPASMIVWLVFNSIWGKVRRNYMIISLLTWSALVCVVVSLLCFGITAWKLLILGIPGQIIICIWSRLQYRKR
ncbi:MAG: helix-turn-helix transcriptional regulator [Oscillospiraceae bacterium]|nr:helix-turn-helix transcriptional regulator [Oscillospiraceae bacterium]